jgi:uncharacterized membrane protein YdbT with pleckstrin-like domain
MTDTPIHTSKPAGFSLGVLSLWFVPVIALAMLAFFSRADAISFWSSVGLALLIGAVFIIWIPVQYEIMDDRLRIKCKILKKDIHFKDIKSIDHLSTASLVWRALLDKGVYMTSFKNSIYIKVASVLNPSTQVSPSDHTEFLAKLNESLEQYKIST